MIKPQFLRKTPCMAKKFGYRVLHYRRKFFVTSIKKQSSGMFIRRTALKDLSYCI